MATSNGPRIFKTNRRIRLGIWGLGRGLSFFKVCHDLNTDVVAGCDFNEHMRRRFAELVPDAFVTEKAEDFLNYDMDAVLVSTFCPAHAGDAIAALEAGKHVLSEVTAFHTMAEGVRLVEAVERSGPGLSDDRELPLEPQPRLRREEVARGAVRRLHVRRVQLRPQLPLARLHLH
jgi:predicted dehydrogenase